MCGIGCFCVLWLTVLMFLKLFGFVILPLIFLYVGCNRVVHTLAPFIGMKSVEAIGILFQMLHGNQATKWESLVCNVGDKLNSFLDLCAECFTFCYSSKEVNELSLNLFHCYSNLC